MSNSLRRKDRPILSQRRHFDEYRRLLALWEDHSVTEIAFIIGKPRASVYNGMKKALEARSKGWLSDEDYWPSQRADGSET